MKPSMTPEERLAFDQKIWHDAEFRRAHIEQLQMHNALVAGIFTTARVNGLSESAAIEVAMIALAEESEHFQDVACKAIGRGLAMPGGI